ncbi:MAG: response regulator transcription factor [Anaerolineales bacterium]
MKLLTHAVHFCIMDALSVAEKTLETGKSIRVSLMDKQIRVLIVDDHSGVRAGLRNLLLAAKDIAVVGEGGSGAEAIELVATKNPDVLLLDIELPDQRGDLVMRHIHDMQPDIKVIAVSSYTDRDYILGMMQNGAAGYITKDEAPGMLIEAIRNIVKTGENFFSPRAVKNSIPTSLEQQTLTKREIQIFEQLVQDRSAEEIAAFLGISKAQVESYLKLLMKKYETDSLIALKHMAQRVLARRSP